VYGYNRDLADDSSRAPKTMVAISKPTRTVLLACNVGKGGGGLDLIPFGPPDRAKQYGWTGPTYKNGPSPNHGRFANFLFADGHVEAADVTRTDTWPWNVPNALRVPAP
jgi:prepilin-type processing-associated H-X9-DG protein